MSHEKDSELEDNPIESIFSLEYYENVIDQLKNFGPALSYLRIKSEFDKLTQEKFSLDYINFIVIIGDTEYLLFLKTTKPGTLTERDLKLFFSIFSKDTKKEGIIIVWDDLNLPAIKLGEADLHVDYNVVLEDIKKNIKELKKILEEEIRKTKKISETVKIPEKKFTKEISLDIVNEFKNYLDNSYDSKKESYRSQKSEILSRIKPETFEMIINLFNDYFLKKISIENLEKNYRKIIKDNFEE